MDKQACRTLLTSGRVTSVSHSELKNKDVHKMKKARITKGKARITKGKAGRSRFVNGLSQKLVPKTDLATMREQKGDER